jgi:hypothetical protein
VKSSYWQMLQQSQYLAAEDCEQLLRFYPQFVFPRFCFSFGAADTALA